MNKAILIFIILGSFCFSQTFVNWQNTSVAFEESKKSDKIVMLYVKTKWCSFCRKIDKESFQNEKIAKFINENFIPTKLDAESRIDIVRINDRFYTAKEYTGIIGVKSYPTLIFYSEKMIPVAKIEGYYSSEDILNALKFMVKKQQEKQ